jgi:putative transposase
VEIDFSRPGTPTDNAFIEAFNARLRVECLNASWLLSLPDARDRIEAWKTRYNEERPRSALGNLTPRAFANQAQLAREVAERPDRRRGQDQCPKTSHANRTSFRDEDPSGTADVTRSDLAAQVEVWACLTQ